jgi:hypothetical protein
MSDMGKRAVLSVGGGEKKKDICVYREKISHSKSEKYCQLLWGKPITWCYVGDILSGEKVSIYYHLCFHANIGGRQSVVL